MIIDSIGNILEAEAEALVNTVNTQGIMGKGIALQFKLAFPANFKAYQSACRSGLVKLGKMLVFDRGLLESPRFIINFPTKEHWKEKTKIDSINQGLQDLIQVIKERNIHTIAMPPLGCGLGGLDWNIVKPLIIEGLSSIRDVGIYIFSPQGAPRPDIMSVATDKPKLSIAKAALIKIMNEYLMPGYRLSRLEIQKLAYFLQIAGIQELKLAYIQKKYGPYAANLEHLLTSMEGHYTRGFGDKTSEQIAQPSIRVKTEEIEETNDFLKDKQDLIARIMRVEQLIEGFETPYGLELLSSVHWVVRVNPSIKNDVEAIIRAVHEWNYHKKAVMKAEHIKVAYDRLYKLNWF